MKIQLRHKYTDIICLENLLLAWQEFIVGKKNKPDVQIFARDLMDNIISLHQDLANGTYRHGGYESFFVNDPKRRHIHKASVRDRLLHHAVYRILYPFFDRTFIANSFSCRLNKGTHKAVNRFREFANKVGQNNTATCWVLKGDIKKFFASIAHGILLNILDEYIPDKEIMGLLKNIILSFPPHCHVEHIRSAQYKLRETSLSQLVNGQGSFTSSRQGGTSFRMTTVGDQPEIPRRPATAGLARNDSIGIGLPLGNLTSQLFANVYLNVFDQCVKHRLAVETRHASSLQAYYIRYADDFVILSQDKNYLLSLIPKIQHFLSNRLKLTLHPNKIILKTLASGADFLGWVNFPRYRVLRRTTRRRMFSHLRDNPSFESLQSHLGLLGHGSAYLLEQELLNRHWLVAKSS